MTAPVLILIGEADQWNGADACKTLRNLARPDSASIDLTVYPGVHHAFDVAQLKPGRSSDGDGSNTTSRPRATRSRKPAPFSPSTL